MKQRKNQSQLPISLKRQEGVVIVMALLIVAIVTALSYAMMARLERDTRRTTLMLRDTQAENLAQGSVIWAVDQLRVDLEKAQPNQLVDLIPIKSPINEVDHFKVFSVIYDMQARFNVNSLIKPEAQARFKQLLKIVEPKISNEAAQEVTLAIADWLAPGSKHDEYVKYYAELPVPYRPADQVMFNASELRLVKGITPALFAALQPYVVALPPETPINVQTAPVPVLATLSSTMTVATAKAIEDIRKTKPFVTPQVFSELDLIKSHPVEAALITTQSNYFLVETTVTIENQRLVIYTLLERSGAHDKVVVNILWQSKGIW